MRLQTDLYTRHTKIWMKRYGTGSGILQRLQQPAFRQPEYEPGQRQLRQNHSHCADAERDSDRAEADVLEQFAIACTERGGSPTVREGAGSESTPSLTVGLPPHAANPINANEN